MLSPRALEAGEPTPAQTAVREERVVKHTPDWACPRTLLWVAEQLDTHRLHVESKRKKLSLPRRDGTVSLELRKFAERYAGQADACHSIAYKLRNRATRQEKKRKPLCGTGGSR